VYKLGRAFQDHRENEKGKKEFRYPIVVDDRPSSLIFEELQ
jgi:hypothetical protein